MTIQDAALTRHNGAIDLAPGSPEFLPQNIDEAMKLAETLARSTMVPKTFQGKPQDILLCIIDALSRGRNPILHIQSRYVVHGQAAINGKGLIAEANASGRFKGCLKFKFEGSGDGLTATCHAVERETGEAVEYAFSMAEAKQAGFTSNVKYRELPRQMLAYRAATFLCRLYIPDVIQGLIVEGEEGGMSNGPRYAGSAATDPLDSLLDAPDATAAAIKEAVHTVVEEPKPEFAPPEVVAKLIARFEELGVSLEELTESFGPLDKMTSQTFQEAREYGAMKAKQAKDAQQQPQQAEAFGEPGGEDYD